MADYTRPGCGTVLTIHAPEPGQFDPAAFARFTGTDDLFGLDIESTAFTDPGVFAAGWRLRLIQFGTPREAWVLDPADPAQEAAAASLLDRARFVSHTPVDVKAVWAHFGIALGQRVLDTHLLSKIIDPDERAGHGLKELAGRHIDDGLQRAEDDLGAWVKAHAPKGCRGSIQRARWGWDNVPATEPAYTIYAGLDAIYCRCLLAVLMRQCAAVGHVVHMEHWLAAQTTAASLRGLALDQDYTRGILADVESDYLAADRAIQDALGFPSRSPRFAQWIDGHGNLPELPRTAKRRDLKITTQIDGVTQLAPALWRAAETWPARDRELLAARDTVAHTANVLSNLRQFLSHADPAGYVHPAVNTLRARTARMSITAPALQTLRKPSDTPGSGRLRHCFRADEGHVLVSCDFAQIEVRVAAALSRDPALIRAILRGDDVHDVTARALWGGGFTKTQRNIGKRATFGTIYGGGARALAAQTGTPLAEARALTQRWHRQYPGIGRYARAVARQDPVVTATGRRIPPDPWRPYASINYAVQSTARDLLVQAVYDLFTAHGLGPSLWLFVHDEVILHVPAADADDAAKLLEDAMTFSFRGVPVAAEAEVLGTHWGKENE